MHVLVTGGAGFIGSTLCLSLLRRGDSVTVLDNFDPGYSRAIKEANLGTLNPFEQFGMVEGDIRNDADLDRAFTRAEKVDAVIHLAAQTGVRNSLIAPVFYQQVNVEGTLRVMEAMRRHQVTRLVFGSSSSVYGNRSKMPFCEDDAAVYPISPYAASKRNGELLAYTYHHLYGMDITCLRFFTVFGPRQRPDLAIHHFARHMLARAPIKIFGDGRSSRDYTYVDDIVGGVISALERLSGFRTYNLGSGRPITLLDLVSALEQVLGRPATVEHVAPKAGDMDHTLADIRKAGLELEYVPRMSLVEGLSRFVFWLERSIATGET